MSGFTIAYLARLEVWTLAAVLLQGCLAWLSWRGWSAGTRAAAPRLRHRVAAGHFASLPVLVLATVLVLHSTAVNLRGPVAGLGDEDQAWPAFVYDVALQAAPSLARVWAAGVAVMLAVVLVQARRLRLLKSQPAGEDMHALVHVLVQRALSLRGPTLRAAAVDTPQVTGLLHPVLTIPFDLGDRLNRDEQEAVLLHELAHVRRGDFGWNLVQRLVLALLWFHPAAWRLHRALSREREACCDDFAVEQGASRLALARALVRLAEAPRAPSLVMGVSPVDALSGRVRRLLAPTSDGPPPKVGVAAAVLIVLSSVSAIGAGRLATLDPAFGDLSRASAFGPTISISAHDRQGRFRVSVRRGRVVAAAVGAQPLPAGLIVQHGSKVALMQPGRREPLLLLAVTPGGRISWEPRA